MIDRMAEARLIERRRDLGDRRAWNLYRTGEARPLLEQLRHIADDVLSSALANLSQQDVDEFTSVIIGIRSNLKAEPVSGVLPMADFDTIDGLVAVANRVFNVALS